MMVMLLFDDDFGDFGHGINVDHNDDDDSDHNDKKGDDRKGCKVETKAGSEHLPRPHSWKKMCTRSLWVDEGHMVILVDRMVMRDIVVESLRRKIQMGGKRLNVDTISEN